MVQLVMQVGDTEGMLVSLMKDQVVENHDGNNQEHHPQKMAQEGMLQLVMQVGDTKGMLVSLMKDQVVENHDGKNQEHHPQKIAQTKCNPSRFG